MEMDNMIANQFSPRVASAQAAKTLDSLAESLLTELLAYDLPKQIRSTGFVIQSGETLHHLSVEAHGVRLKGRFDHVWLNYGHDPKPLGGRIQFFPQNREGQDGEAIYRIVFDSLGNACLGWNGQFSASISPDSHDIDSTLRRLVLEILKAIHDSLDSVDFKR